MVIASVGAAFALSFDTWSQTALFSITAQQLAGALGVACIGGLYFTFAADGSATGMTHGTVAGCIAMLVTLGAAATGFMRLGARQRQLAAAGVASPA